MRALTTPVAAAVVLLAGSFFPFPPPLLAEEVSGIGNWTAPPFWSPAPAGVPADGRREEPEAPDRATLPSGALPFFAIAPCRLVDTRGVGSPWVGDWGPPALIAGTARSFAIPTGPCVGIPANAAAYSLNFTVLGEPGAYENAFLTAWPTGSPRPTVSTLNFSSGQLSVNAAVVPAGTDGSVDVLVAAGAHLVLDVNGYYAALGIVSSLTAGASTLTGDVTVAAGTSIALTPSGNTLTISGPSTLPPSGAAGGSLSGSYPSPAIAKGAVSAGSIAAGQVVKSVNAFTDDVTIQGGGGVTVSNASNVVTISAPAGSMILGAPGDTTIIGQGYTEIGPSGIEFWRPTRTSGAVSRVGHTGVWTGTRMLVWGGRDRDTYRNDGDAYDPATDTWTNMASTGAPTARYDHTAVWTGSLMIVWGGIDSSGTYLSTGGEYSPSGTGSWTATQTAGAPSGRAHHTAVWAGSRMIVWGGFAGGTAVLGDGRRYDPSGAGAWLTMTAGPAARFGHAAVWTGSSMIVWGGQDATGTCLGTGSRYSPSTNGWTTIAYNSSWRTNFAAVWTGSRMIVWGGYDLGSVDGFLDSGFSYDPTTDTWSSMSRGGAPSARAGTAAVWAPELNRMIIWGGDGPGWPLGDGALYDPTTNTWSPMTSDGGPGGRVGHTMVWTGSSLVVWGGSADALYLYHGTNTGGIWSRLSIYSKN